ncbi:MAG: adenylate/guanylate cyclase domain-containing protein [Acaryochloridaceae cyanobacterium RU_4_10]|nr:adenylate/guanylate cyclase domain-containing protein [Acaryochloridaceae cyanobacterium RU_4_10]
MYPLKLPHNPFQTPEAYLTIHPDRNTSYSIPLDRGTCWTIGRDPENVILLGDQWMSRNHALLQKMETGEFYIIDLGSRNGTFVNHRRVNVPTAMRHGDWITFGQTNLQFHEPLQLLDSSPIQASDEPVTTVLHIRRLISVLVIDLRDFTKLTQQLDERVLSELVGTWFHCAGEIIRNHGSWVDKYIGDAVMAVWIHGAWEMKANDIRAPFQALNELHQMTRTLHTSFGISSPLRMGAGINTGYAMVGNTGSGDRPDYTALGDTVNSAFSLESSTKQMGVDLAIGPTTYEYLQKYFGDRLLLQPRKICMKGHDTPRQVYAGTFQDLAHLL